MKKKQTKTVDVKKTKTIAVKLLICEVDALRRIARKAHRGYGTPMQVLARDAVLNLINKSGEPVDYGDDEGQVK